MEIAISLQFYYANNLNILFFHVPLKSIFKDIKLLS